MKILLVSWMLLLFGVSLNSGHYIRKLEDADSQVYRVTEDHSGVKFVNPKPEKPTLREILYYHIVERAYGKEEPVNSIAERSFTNSHGLPFLRDSDDASSETEHIDDEHGEEYKENDETKGQEHENKLEDEIQDEGEVQEEEAEPATETKPLTEKDVKEAYKHRSYLFDQLRQRYSPVKRMILPETSSRRKRDAYLEEIPNAPELPESPPKDAYMQPHTYGMNLNSDGGYVWNNLNNPPVYYEVGQSTENPNEGQGQSESGQNQEAQPAETYVPQVTENTDSGSSEDIYVSTDRQPGTPLENQGALEEKPENQPEVVEESEAPVYNPEEKFEESEKPIEPVVNDDLVPDDYNATEQLEPSQKPIEPVVNDESVPDDYNPNEKLEVPEGPIEPVVNDELVTDDYNPNEKLEAPERPIEPVVNDESVPDDYNPGVEIPEFENPEKALESGEPIEKPADSGLDTAASSTESSEGEEAKVIPEAPTLPPFNLDNLPDYIRDSISSTEKSESPELTDNPFINPQLDSEDKKKLEENMENIFATVQPVEDIPKTYGVNLTGDSGHVWNDMVNPPVAHEVGSTDKKEEEPKAPEPTEQPNQESQEEPKPEEQPVLENPEDKETEVSELENPEETVPEIPKIPEAEIPDIPKIPEAEVPEIPKIPEAEVPDIPKIPEAEAPEIPKIPEAEVPDIPKIPEAEVPEIPKIPESEVPDIPKIPEAEVPEIPKIPEAEVPEIPKIPEAEVPEIPKIPEAEVPEIPKVPESENPEDKEAEVPEISENPGPIPEIPDIEDKPAELPVEPTPEDKEPSLEPGTSEGDIPKPEEGEETGDVLPEPKPEEEKKPDIMSELLKSEAFWKWLGEWTAKYMELLEKHMRKIAIQEICNREKSGTDMCVLNDQPEDTGLLIKDGKIILDGKEIPVTHNSNFDELRRGNNNNKDKEINKVDATTIYGNSVGNERVNNVFIFNAVDAKEVLEELKPGNDSKIDVIIDERGKENEDDEIKEDDKIEDKIEVPKESEEIEKPIEEQKEIEDKPISSELESDKESTEKLPIEE